MKLIEVFCVSILRIFREILQKSLMCLIYRKEWLVLWKDFCMVDGKHYRLGGFRL